MHRPILGAACAFVAAFACNAGEHAPPPPKLRFDPAESEHLDVAVGEEVSFPIALVAEGGFDWSSIRVATTCECLSAVVTGQAKDGRVPVEVTIHGHQPEDIHGGITAQDARDPQKAMLAEHVARLAIRRAPFTAPRAVAIAPAAEPRFDLVLGQAFPLGAELPPTILVDVSGFDETRLQLIDLADESAPLPKLAPKSVLLTTRLTFLVVAEDLASPFEVEIPVEFGEPPVKRRVKARWPGRKGGEAGGH